MRQALELALESLLHAYHEDEAHPKTLETINAIKEALAQPEQEPVVCIEDGNLYFANEIDWQTLQQQGIAVQLLYTTPPQRKPLTRERLVEMAEAQCGLERTFEDWVELFAREIEAAHNIKE